jgi:hypothetical protein
MVYLQKGIRWIPSYKVTIDGQGNAKVQLNATLLNEMTDLVDVTANLVIGVPTFAFKETIDPMSLEQAMAQLSQYFDQGSQTAYAFSNGTMTQMARMGEHRVQVPQPATAVDLGPEIGDSDKSEDLFIFTVKNVTLLKGQRMVLPVVEYTLSYRDVFVMDLPFAPPVEVRQHFNSQQQAELARLFHAPKAMHKIRLTNDSPYPLTTAPALIVRGDRLLAQGMMTYTAVGANTDLAVTAAVDIQVKLTDVETKRTPDAAQWHSDRFSRIDLDGKISLHNYRGQPTELEVTRYVLGAIAEVDHEGTTERLNVHQQGWLATDSGYPHWWRWYDWPYWWYHFNSVTRVTWKVTLDAGQQVDLGYSWYYYWR